jgi:hypothetical protein
MLMAIPKSVLFAAIGIVLSMAAPVIAQAPVPQPVPHPAKPTDLQPLEDVKPPPQVKSGEPMPAPIVTTRREGDTVIEEFRIKGKLYQQRIKPPNGPAYVLTDEKGDGKFVRNDGPDVKVSPPMWVILEW